ncbi:MAG: efflux transporter outer membrane subunit, partial [Deltaproteobacteria bacterium]|nr:efflux transporter outer membrane subunit [Deltaproteobacteria bacterium]
ASYEIDLWGKVRYARNAAKHSLAASAEDLRAAYITLAAQVTDTYYLLVQQRALIVLLDETIKSREAQVELVKRRYQSGVLRAADLYQALGSLAAAKAQRAQTRGALRRGVNALAALIGCYPGQIDAGKLDVLPPKLLHVSSGLPGQLLLQRPDLRAAFMRLKAADQTVGAAFAAHFPSLSIGGSLGRAIEPTAGTVWSIFASLTGPIFNGGAIHARYKERKAQLREAIAGFKKALLMAVKETEDALIRGQTTEERIKHLEMRVLTAEGALRLSTDRYRQGLTIYLAVLTSEQALLGARTELLAARRELISARVSLARALGGSWMNEDIKRQHDAAQGRSRTKKPAKKRSGAPASSKTSTVSAKRPSKSTKTPAPRG